MLHDCNLKIYHPLNIQYEFNLGIIVLYIIEGKASISINHSKNEYKSGDVIIINDLELFGVITNKDTIIACLTLSRIELDEIYHFNKRYFLNPNKIDNALLKARMIKLISNYLNREGRENRNVLESIFGSINDVAKLLFDSRVIDDNYLNYGRDKVYSDIANTIDYVYKNNKNKITIAEVARTSLYSKRKLSNKLRQHTGRKFTDLLKDVRLIYSSYELMYTAHTLSQIAIDNGYSNESSFIKNFRERYDITPGKFRKQMYQDEYFSFRNDKTSLMDDFSMLREFIRESEMSLIVEDNIEIDMRDVQSSNVLSPDLLVYVTHKETLTNQYHQSKLLCMRREYGKYCLLFSHALLCEFYELGFEDNKIIDQIFSFCLENQFDISFEIQLNKHSSLNNFLIYFERLLIYLTECTYYYGMQSFKFYIDTSYQQFNIITETVSKYLVDATMILILNTRNDYLAHRMSHKLDSHFLISYKIKNETDINKEISEKFKDIPSFNILYQPKFPNRITSLVSIFKWSVFHNEKVTMLINDIWIDSMIPSQSSHFMIKEKQSNIESQRQLFELMLTLKRLRGEIVYFNEHILLTNYFYEYQLLVFPNTHSFKMMHQRIKMKNIEINSFVCRPNNIIISENTKLGNNELLTNMDLELREVSIVKEPNNLIVQYYSSPSFIKHIYIKIK